ncbi:MAG TPA: glycosyltransferase, partial [Nitrospira sp.]
SFDYRKRQREGMKAAAPWSYDALAGQWESQVAQWFTERSRGNKLGVMRQLLHEDDHVAARMVAEDILNEDGKMVADARFHEADAALAFCDRVIDGKDQNADDYGERAIQDPLEEIKLSDRFRHVGPWFTDCTRVLDVACGNGSFALHLAQLHPEIRVHGIDYSPANIAMAQATAEKIGVADRITFEVGTIYDFDKHELHADWKNFLVNMAVGGVKPFDGLFVGEFVEHVANTQALVDGLEEALAPNAFVLYTCPNGNYIELHPRELKVKRGHVHRFAHDDIAAVWGKKDRFACDYMDGGMTEAGTFIGCWLISYRYQPNRPAGQRPYQERIARTRPRQRLSVGLIAKNAEQDIARCLSSVYKIADEIVVGLDGKSVDSTENIVQHFGEKVRMFHLDPVDEQPEGFAGARNEVLQHCKGEWFLWIDADEQLVNGPFLRKYLDGHVFHGYVIHQTHLYLDGAPTFDIPVRLFRNTGKVRFYGCIHEQPQDGNPNADIYPTLDAMDLNIAHTGYLTADGREDKRVRRNMPLLRKDQQVFGDRVLGKVLLMREAVIEGDLQRVTTGVVGDGAKRNYLFAVKTFI